MRASLLFVLLVGLAACKDLAVEEGAKTPAKVAAKKQVKEAAAVVTESSEEEIKVPAKAPKVTGKSAKLADAAEAAVDSAAAVPAAVAPKTSASTKPKVDADKPLKRVKRGPGANYQTCIGNNNDNSYDTTSKLLAYLQQLTYQLQYCDQNQGCGGYYGGYYGCGGCPYGGYWPNCYYPYAAYGKSLTPGAPDNVGDDPNKEKQPLPGTQDAPSDPLGLPRGFPLGGLPQFPLQGGPDQNVRALGQQVQQQQIPPQFLFQGAPDPNAPQVPINGQYGLPRQFPNPQAQGSQVRSFPFDFDMGHHGGDDETTSTTTTTTTTAAPTTAESAELCEYSDEDKEKDKKE